MAVGLVETHGRTDTAALIDGLEVIPRRTVTYRGNTFEEMDLDAVLRRKPDIALIDELAHTNVPGSGHEKRWEDVEVLLAAGIDVITTLNIQHLESMNDVVTAITGVVQRETIPDEVVRRADEIEMVDLTQEGIRERMAAGKIYPAERIDAALANFFRPGNLGALRELALSWTADRVDEALERYRETHGIDASWETKERVVVAIAGLAGGDHVVRRAARMAMRARSELLGVHVRAQDGLAVGSQAADELASQRRLLTDLGGTYHDVVGDDVGEALVRFARAENATQLVMGASRRTRWEELLRGSPILEVVRRSGPIDVHVISHPGVARQKAGHPQPAQVASASPPPHRRVGCWRSSFPCWRRRHLFPFREQTGLDTELLVFLLVTVAVAAVGGILPALVASMHRLPPGELVLHRADGHLHHRRARQPLHPDRLPRSSPAPLAGWSGLASRRVDRGEQGTPRSGGIGHARRLDHPRPRRARRPSPPDQGDIRVGGGGRAPTDRLGVGGGGERR